MNDQHPIPAMRWKHRRRLAYLCTTAAIAPLFAAFVPALQPGLLALAPIYPSAALFCGAVAGAYVGCATWHQVKQRPRFQPHASPSHQPRTTPVIRRPDDV